MATIARLRIDLSGGGVIGPGVMTFYSSAGGVGLPAAAHTWLEAIKANLPPSLVATVPNNGDLINDATGGLISTWSSGTGGVTTGTGVGGFALGVGGRVKWATGGTVDGRRVRGSTFLVPLMSGSFETTGIIRAATVTALQTPTSAFLSTMAGDLVIWSRPRPADPTHVPPRVFRAGSSWPILSGTIDVDPATLRSRRT